MGRQKPGKPRRERSEQTHRHGDGLDHDAQTVAGRPVDSGLLAETMGAAIDGCTSCQDVHLTLLTQDSISCTRLVEVACMAIQDVFGGLPATLLDDAAPGETSSEFRLLARTGVDGKQADMWKACDEMSPERRRAAVNDALDLLAGVL